MAAKITIHEMSPEELNNLIQKTVKNEFEHMSNEFQKAFGEDDLINSELPSIDQNVEILLRHSQ